MLVVCNCAVPEARFEKATMVLVAWAVLMDWAEPMVELVTSVGVAFWSACACALALGSDDESVPLAVGAICTLVNSQSLASL